MANYLPVLLISVSTNAVPDDSSLSTLPRAQVDYLSHDWQEEDVWKSWRKMTRQKNEIANGMRLENASWRTWWKQRNKLKTVSPETLNWLKDSDVTWLYGPLHTAVDWTPPPKPQPVPSLNPAPAHDQLELFSPNATLNTQPRKPILKHRSISELLTSDLISTSPVFSPVESEDEGSISPTASSTSFLSFAAGYKSKRPILTHTKSDTHITRWGASRSFRKDSPPRIDPPGFDASKSQNQSQTHGNISSQLGPIRGSASQDSSSSGGVGHTSSSGERPKKKHISFNTYVEQYIAIEKPKKNTSGFFGPSQEGNWVTGRTTYPIDDGYEEDEEDSEEDTKQVHKRDTPIMRSYTGSPDEDEDDGVIEMRSSSHRNHTKTKLSVRSQSKVSTASSSSSTSTASTSSTNSSHASTDTTSPAGSLSPSRIHRKTSSSSSTATPRRNSSSTYRPSVNSYTTRRGQPPPFIRTPSEHVHFTIAPIAPAILKTTGVWSESLGDEGGSDDGFGSWNTKGTWFRQDTSAGNGKKGKSKATELYESFGMCGGSDKEGQSSDGTSVELVYVPPFRSNYSLGMGRMGDDDDDGDGRYEEDEYKEPEEHQDVIDRVAQGAAEWDVYHHPTGVTDGISIASTSSPPMTAPIPIASVRSPTPALPTVVVDDQTTTALSFSGQIKSRGGSRPENRQRSSVDEEDAYDFFSGLDLDGDCSYARRGGRGCDRGGSVPSQSSPGAAALGGGFSTSGSERQRERERERRKVVPGGEERQSRSRSRSQSRTPSPAFISSPVSTAPAPTTLNGQAQGGRRRSSSASATPSGPACFMPTSFLTGDLLSPPSQRGRAPIQPQSQSQSRGRSSTRTASTSSWEGESGSSVGSSPMGSLSPDGLVRAGGREREREKEREKERGMERRGRERTSGRMLSASEVLNTSEVESAASSGVRAGSGSSSTSTTRDAGGASGRVATDSNFSSTTSSCSSSTSTVMGPPPSKAISVNISPINEDQEHRPSFLQQQEVEHMRRAEEEQRRKVHPTPSSSPALGMKTSVPPGARSGVFEEHATLDQKYKAQGSTPSVSSGTIPTGTTAPSMAELILSIPPPPTPPSSPTLPHAGGVGHTRSSSYSESAPHSTALLSPSKLRPPPLIPPPPVPAKPSTSFTAVSSSSPASPIISAITTTTTTSNKGLPSPTFATPGEHTIVGKAVDIVSSAGAFLGLWQHSSIPEGSC
ncbi:hypothetical protein BYT27DRAFT_7136157 [Phlegmacium glaucopus]|nr:hypothetical protein BYT27DRAFT_7136157 [Phlegmacium glaucopus]